MASDDPSSADHKNSFGDSNFNLQKTVKKYGLKIWRKPRLLLSLLALVLVVSLVLTDRENIFTLNASTEIVAFSITDTVLSEWQIGNAELMDDPFAENNAKPLIDVTLFSETGSRIRIQRHGVGDVRILLTATDGKSVGRVEDGSGKTIPLSDWALLKVKPADKPLVFPFRGKLVAGDDVAIGVDSILLAGTVSVVEEQLVGKTHYVAGIEELDPGDRVQLWDKLRLWDRLKSWIRESGQTHRRSAAIVDGFVRAEPEGGFSEPADALSLVAHGSADFVKVDRLGTAGYQVRAPRWARFLHDPLLAAATAIVALLALLFECSSKCVELVSKPGNNDEKLDEQKDKFVNKDNMRKETAEPPS